MENDTPETKTAPLASKRKEVPDYACYEEGDSLVICDRENTNAWIKSDVFTTLKQ